MTPRETQPRTQMNLQFIKSEPMILPQDKQRELAMALADLLLNAAVIDPAEWDEGDSDEPQNNARSP